MVARGLTVEAAVGALSLLSIFTTVGQFTSGFALDRIDSAKISAGYVALYALGVVMIALTSDQTGPWTLYAGVILLGLGGGVAPMANYFFTRYFGLRSFAELMGIFRGLMAFITGLSPWVIGLIYDSTGSYDVAFVILIMGTVSSVIILALLPPYRYGVATPLAPPPKPEPAS